MRAFKNPGASLGDLKAKAVAAVVMAAADIALVVDGDGVIRDVSISNQDLSMALDACRDWVGRSWREFVTADSRPKLEALLADATDGVPPKWRHLNHPSAHGLDVPVMYSAIRVGGQTRTLAIGRDLRGIANLQQRLVDAQQSLDQDYARLQQLELRFRLLFQTSHEAIVIVDISTSRVMEANPAATKLFGENVKRITGRPIAEVFTQASAAEVQRLLNSVRASGRPDEAKVRLAHSNAPITVSAHIFRQDAQSLGLVRLSATEPAREVPRRADDDRADLRSLVEHAPDAFAVTGADGRVAYVNAAFLDLAQLSHHEQAQGEPLDRWLGQPGVDVGVLIANLKQRGSIRLFATILRGEHGVRSDVEVSAVAVTHDRHPVFGFTVRNVARRWTPDGSAGPKALPRTPEQLTELIGRVPLKDLVRETTDVIERLCIEAALELTGNNRASAAETLGVSRQSLYVKLRRFGIADGEDETDV